MQIGLVLGNVTATIKHPSFEGEKMLVVQLEGAEGRDDGEPVICFDRMGASRGDRVLVTSDGSIIEEMLGKGTPARWSVMGITDL